MEIMRLCPHHLYPLPLVFQKAMFHRGDVDPNILLGQLPGYLTVYMASLLAMVVIAPKIASTSASIPRLLGG